MSPQQYRESVDRCAEQQAQAMMRLGRSVGNPIGRTCKPKPSGYMLSRNGKVHERQRGSYWLYAN